MLNLSNITYQQKEDPGVICSQIDNTKIGHKLHLPVKLAFLNNDFKHCSAMVDSGSDIDLIQLSYFYRLFPEIKEKDLKSKLNSTSLKLTSYTNHTIRIVGIAKIKISCDRFHPTENIREIDLFVVENKTHTRTPFILSLGSLGKFDINMKFKNIEGISTPRLHKQSNLGEYIIPSYYYNEIQLSFCHGYVDKLNPGESRKVMFIISPVSPLVKGDNCLISQDTVPYFEMKNIRISPSTSSLEEIQGELIGFAQVINSGKLPFSGVIKATADLVDKSYEIKKINIHSIQDIQTMKLNLISDCYLPCSTDPSTKIININKELNLHKKKTHFIPQDVFSLDLVFPQNHPDKSNHKAVNNDVKDVSKSLTEERHKINETFHKISNEDLNKYYDPSTSIQMSYQDNLPDITEEDMQPKGTSIPSSLIESPSDLIKEKDFEKDVWPFVKEIFLDKYPNIISKHALDHGSLSSTLGYYTVRIKENMTLPRYKKLYYLDPEASSQMRDTLEFLCRTKVITKASCAGGDIPDFASPSFLVKKSSDQKPARLVVDYRLLNEVLALEPITLSNFDIILNELRDATMYTTLDLKAAFDSILLHPDSRKYTLFTSQFGAYYFNSLATGMAVSPNTLNRFCDRMIHYIPSVNEKGQIIYDNNGYPVMIPQKLDNCQIFYDDLIIYTKPEKTYKETLKKHFELVEEVAKRLNFHNAKIELSKAQFAKFLVNFMGWLISNNTLQPDPKRIAKLQNTPFPKDVTGMRSFQGLVNFLRLVLGFDTLREIHKISPLTSGEKKAKLNPTDEQIAAVERLKKSLTASPLYSKICLPNCSKILMTDSASEQHAAFSCVLAQIVPAKRPIPYVPFYLFLEDDTHKIIYDLKLPVRPIHNKPNHISPKEYLTTLQISHPPEFLYLKDPTLGYGDQVDNSFGISLQSMLLAHNCKTIYEDICKKTLKEIKENVAYFQILQNTFKNNKHDMEMYLHSLQKGVMKLDSDLHIIRAVAKVLYRKFVIINSTDKFKDKQIAFNPKESSPPFFFLLYKRENKLIIRPTVLEKHTEYQMGKHRGSFEIVLYHSKTIPKPMQNSKISDLELYALLSSLKAVERLVGRDELLLLIDNKCLYYAFHSTTLKSSTKIVGWAKTLVQKYPNIQLGFVSSRNNPADYLTRYYGIDKAEISRVKLPTYIDHLLDDYIPQDKVFTLTEWIEWVKQNEQFIKYEPQVNFIQSMEYCIDLLNIEEPQPITSPKCQTLNPKLHNNKPKYENISTLEQAKPLTINNQKILNNGEDAKLYIINEEKFLDHTAICKINSLNATKKPYSTNYALSNAQAIFNPIKALQSILTHETIIKEQQIEFANIYKQYILTKAATVEIDNKNYSIELGILYIHENIPKLCIPTKLLPEYISMAHLASNHSGTKKIMTNLSNYYHKDLRKKAERFTSMCIACILVNYPTKVQKLGFFPLDACPGQCLHMDVMESLGKASGDNHILVCKDPITNFALLLPLEKKTAENYIRVFNASIYPIFHPAAVFVDNGTIFTNQESLKTLAAMGTKTIYSTAYTGFSHGAAEQFVGWFKKTMRKVLSAQPNLNWTAIPAMISHIHNVSKTNKTGYSPAEIIFGPNNHLSKSYLDTKELPAIHPLVKNATNEIEKKHGKMQSIMSEVQEKNVQEQSKRLEYVNKHKIFKQFELGDLVFLRDRTIPTGSTKPLRTYLLNDPCIVIQIKDASMVVRRITDNMTIYNRSKNDVKKYIKFDDEFKSLPEAVRKICEQEPPNLTEQDIKDLLKLGLTNFEQFGTSTKDNYTNLKEILDELDSNPVEPTPLRQDLIDQYLEEDEDPDHIGASTRFQVNEKIDNNLKVHFQDQLTTDNKK
jgi:hypothetical protein